jgi:hypothetical protein
MHSVTVRDVVGPLPYNSNSCLIIASVDSKTFSIPCSYSDGMTCRSILNQQLIGSNAYSFLHDTFQTLDIKIEKVELENINGLIYGKILLATPAVKKPLKIASSSSSAVINTALSAEIKIEVSDNFVSVVQDSSTEYNKLKVSFESLWPLDKPTSNSRLQALSELVDKVQFNVHEIYSES